MVQLNQSNSGSPDLRTTEQRIAWGKANGLPATHMIVSVAEVNHIHQTIEAAVSDNMAWRMVYTALSLERDRYRLALVKLRDEGNEYAKEILSQET